MKDRDRGHAGAPQALHEGDRMRRRVWGSRRGGDRLTAGGPRAGRPSARAVSATDGPGPARRKMCSGTQDAGPRRGFARIGLVRRPQINTIEHRFSGNGPRTKSEPTRRNSSPSSGCDLKCRRAARRRLLAGDPDHSDRLHQRLRSGSRAVMSSASPSRRTHRFSVSEAPPIAGKWLELLKEIAPQISRVMVIMEADAPSQPLMANAVVVPRRLSASPPHRFGSRDRRLRP